MGRLKNSVKLLCIAMAAILCVTYVFAVPAFTLDMDYMEQEEASSSEEADNTEETEQEESEEDKPVDNNTEEGGQEENDGTGPEEPEQGNSEEDSTEEDDSEEDSAEEDDSEEDSTEEDDSEEDGTEEDEPGEDNPEEGDPENPEQEEGSDPDSEEGGDGEDENGIESERESTVLVSLETKVDGDTTIIVETEISGAYVDSVWLNAEELFPDSENETAEESIRYHAFYDRTVEELGEGEPDNIRFFDIGIMTGDEEIQPASSAEVTILYADEPDEEIIFQAVRFVERNEAAEKFDIGNYDTGVIEVARDDGNGNAITFEDDGLFVYAIAMTNDFSTWTLTAEGDTYSIKVTYGRDAMIPDGAELDVDEITEETDADMYTEYIEQAAEALYGDPETVLEVARLFDISILSDGENVEPAAPVQVEVTLVEPEESRNISKISMYNRSGQGKGDGEIRVVHFGVKKTEVMDTEITDGEETVSFETDGFSLYAVVKLDEFFASQSGTSVLKKLDGKSFAIVSSTNSGSYGALGTTSKKTTDTASPVDGLAAIPVDIDTAISTYGKDAAGVTEWIFEAIGTGFNIYTYVSMNDELKDVKVKMYLHFTVDKNDPTRSSLTLSEKPQKITVTEGIGELAGRYRLSCGGNSLNLESQNVEKAFHGWYGADNLITEPDKRKTLFMWLCTIESEEQSSIDLDGQTFAIVYKGARDGDRVAGRDDNIIGTKNAALTAENVTNLDDKDRLKAESVELDGDKITNPGEMEHPETWTFKKEGNGYKIYANEENGYLAVDSNGQISLSNETGATTFAVVTKGSNRCRIGWENPNNKITYYLNLDNSNIQDGFNFWDAAWYDVPWYENESSFGGTPWEEAPAEWREDPNCKTRDNRESYNSGDRVYSTNWTWGTIAGKWTAEEAELAGHPNWAGDWKVMHADPENEKLYLYLCEPYDADWPLNGYEYAIVSATDKQRALLAQASESPGFLKASGTVLILPDSGTFPDNIGNISLWTFEKVDNKPGYYYISTATDSGQKYLYFKEENSLELVDNRSRAAEIQVISGEGVAEGCYAFTVDYDNGNNKYYLNGNDSNNAGFHSWYRDSSDGPNYNNGDYFYLLTPSAQRAYVIVNLLHQDSSNTVAGFDSQTGPKEGAALTNNIQSNAQEISACRVYVWDEINDDTRADYGARYVYSSPSYNGSPSNWVFFSAGEENKYYIALINNGGSLQYLSSTGDKFEFNDEKVENDNRFIFTIKPARLKDGVSDSVMTIENSGGYRLYGVATVNANTNTRAIKAHRSSNPTGVVPSEEQFVLCDLIDGVPDKVVAEKISSQEIKDGDKVVIYYRELTDESTMEYSYFAIDRDGMRREVTDVSDSIKYWATDSPNIEWLVRDDGEDFLTFFTYDTMAGQYAGILPGGNGQNSISDSIIRTSTGSLREMTAVRLPGREQGNYGSEIENWVYPKESFYGIKYDMNSERFLPVEAGEEDEIEFYFAKVQDGNGGDSGDEETLETVATVNSKDLGITIKMYDFDSNLSSPGGNAGQRSNAIESVLARGTENIENENSQAGILMPVMGDDGYPVAYQADGKTEGKSLSELFDDSNDERYMGEANNLFLQSIYDTTGYLQYRSENNYAYFNAPADKANGVGNFTVYKDVGASDSRQLPTFSHGNFFPYDPLEGTVITDNNYYLFDHESLQLDMSDPRFGDRIHLIENPDYHFGMTVEAKFAQSRDGIANNGDPLYFSFNGDDDMWVFVDKVLMLDIGGVHGARGGFINFRTGEIWQQDDGQTGKELRTSIAQRFKDAGKFPDGSDWNDAMTGRYFTNLTMDNGNYVTGTFKNYTSHVLNMYYLERGAGASNLDLTLNLIPREDGHIYVGKELSAEDDDDYQGNYGNMEYTFRAYRMIPEDNGGYREEVAGGRDYTLYDANGNVIAPTDANETYHQTKEDGTFTLKPGQYADFFWIEITDTAVDYHYRVEELFENDPGQSYKVYINGEETETEAVLIDDESDPYKGRWAVRSGVLELDRQQQLVMFDNRLRTTAELHLLKEVKDTIYPDAVPDNSKTFNFVLFFENEEGKLIPYSKGEYTIDGEKGVRQADANGRIKIQAGQTAVVKGIMPGTKFFVYEEEADGFAAVEYKYNNGEPKTPEELDSEIVPIPTEVEHNGFTTTTMIDTEMKGIAGKVGDYLSESGVTSASVLIVNEIKTVNIVLTKTDQDGEPLEGATFELRYGNPEKTLKGATVKDADNGAKFTINNLPADQVYKLVEAKTPDGYVLLYGDVEFQPTDSGVIIFTDKGDYFLTKEENKDKVYERDEYGNFKVDVTGEVNISDSVFSAPNDVKWKISTNDGITTFDVVIKNVLGTELPSTGGRGTAIFYILGALMAVGAAAALIVRKRITDKR